MFRFVTDTPSGLSPEQAKKYDEIMAKNKGEIDMYFVERLK